MSPYAGGGGGRSHGVSANEYSCNTGAQINFGDLTPYITYVSTEVWSLLVFFKCCLLFQSHYGGHGDCAAHSGEPVEQAGGRLAQPSPPVRDPAAPATRASTSGLRGKCPFTILPGLWIRDHYMRIRIQHFQNVLDSFFIEIQIQYFMIIWPDWPS